MAFATLGCKVNRADTLAVEEGLPLQVQVVPFCQVADLYVVNTCTVTGTADRDSRQLIHRAHRRNPRAHILVTGCLADRRPDAVRLPGVVQVVPNSGKASLASRIALLLSPESPMPPGSKMTRDPVYSPRELTRPPLKIQDGCGGHCTYCAVAPARGRPRSLPLSEVLRALVAYGDQGCMEVVLAGIDLGSYGLDHNPPSSLSALVSRLAVERPVPRVRLSSIEIHRLDEEFMRSMAAAGDILCRHLHLPLQSGSDAVLAAMARPYDVATFRAKFQAARAALGEPSLGVDVITGFPGETEADHQATVTLLSELNPSYFHVFPFSSRPGTPAATLPDPVPRPVARARAAELRALSDKCWRSFRQARQGKVTRGVVYFARAQGHLTAFSEEGITIRIQGPDTWMGLIVPIRLGALTSSGMEGQCIVE